MNVNVKVDGLDSKRRCTSGSSLGVPLERRTFVIRVHQGWRTRNTPISGLAAGSFSGFRRRGYREFSNTPSAFSRSACNRSRRSSSIRARIATKSSAARGRTIVFSQVVRLCSGCLSRQNRCRDWTASVPLCAPGLILNLRQDHRASPQGAVGADEGCRMAQCPRAPETPRLDSDGTSPAARERSPYSASLKVRSTHRISINERYGCGKITRPAVTNFTPIRSVLVGHSNQGVASQGPNACLVWPARPASRPVSTAALPRR